MAFLRDRLRIGKTTDTPAYARFEISALFVSASDIVGEERKSRKKRRGVSSGPTWLPLAASPALRFFSSFFFFLPPKSLILEYLERSKQRLVFDSSASDNCSRLKTARRKSTNKTRSEIYFEKFTLLVMLSDETASV